MRLQFDRGTILILDPPADLAVAELPGVLWDSRVSAWRCPAFFYPRLRAVLEASGVRYTDIDPAIGQNPDKRTISLRAYQESALSAWELASRRGLVVLPTGSGKTRLALAAVARLGCSALCLVPTRVLLEQWARAAHELLGVGVGRYGDGEHTLAPVTVATFESGWRHMHGIGDRFDLLIVDEVHHFGSGGRDEALEMSRAPFRLGLTATPPSSIYSGKPLGTASGQATRLAPLGSPIYSAKPLGTASGQATRLAPLGSPVGRLEALMGPVVFELSVGQLAGEFLAPFDQVALPVDLDADESERYHHLDQQFQRVFALYRGSSWEEFTRAAGRSVEGRRALRAWRQARQLLAFPRAKQRLVGSLLARHHGDRVLVFTADNQTAYQVAREHLIMPLTCDIGRKERERVLERFRDGSLRALVSAQVLNEGLDVPEAEVGIVVAGQRGEREHVQRLGRLLRPRPRKRALLYELVVRDTREVRTSHRRRQALAL